MAAPEVGAVAEAELVAVEGPEGLPRRSTETEVERRRDEKALPKRPFELSDGVMPTPSEAFPVAGRKPAEARRLPMKPVCGCPSMPTSFLPVLPRDGVSSAIDGKVVTRVGGAPKPRPDNTR